VQYASITETESMPSQEAEEAHRDRKKGLIVLEGEGHNADVYGASRLSHFVLNVPQKLCVLIFREGYIHFSPHPFLCRGLEGPDCGL